jgi:NAD(P)-dependent dehydrogenase (short-subunit alcohol dehydrogenase family)
VPSSDGGAHGTDAKALVGSVALVTGCARYQGVGRGVALALAAAGADVVVSDVSLGGTRNAGESGEAEAEVGWQGLTDLCEEVRQHGVHADMAVGDVGSFEGARHLVASAVARLGKVDILVNNAAAPRGRDRRLSWEVDPSAWESVLRVNLSGVFWMSTVFARHLLERGAPGRIVNVASVSGKRGSARNAPYCASKFGVLGVTQSMAQELAPHGITVNAVCPGEIDTARGASRRGSSSEEVRPPSPALDLVGRLGTAIDVARAVAFLVDPAASFITGASITIDGGATML